MEVYGWGHRPDSRTPGPEGKRKNQLKLSSKNVLCVAIKTARTLNVCGVALKTV